MAGEEFGPFLRADQQGIAEAARDGEQNRLPLALEQGIGRHGRAKAEFRAGQRARPRAGDTPHRLDGRIVIALRILRQQLGAMHGAIGRKRDDVGESPAAIDPETPR